MSTIGEVAKKVSIASINVSWVINNSGYISQAACLRFENAAHIVVRHKIEQP